MSEEPDSKILITPVATPSSIEEDAAFLEPTASSAAVKKQWYQPYRPPYAMLIISIVELIVYLTISRDGYKLLRYDPNKQIDVWRFVTYMFLHDNVFHIMLNIIIQCIFAVILETKQGSLRVVILYFGGGLVGALGAGCVRSDLVVGASAGVYALLISNLSHVVLNFNSSKSKKWTVLTVSIIVVSDVAYNIFHNQTQEDPLISEGAHIGGAISGFLIGLLLYKSTDKEAKRRNKLAFWFAFVTFAILICTLLFINYQVKRCTPLNLMKVSYVYLC